MKSTNSLLSPPHYFTNNVYISLLTKCFFMISYNGYNNIMTLSYSLKNFNII